MDDTEEEVVTPAPPPPPPSSCLINKGKRTKRQRPLSPIPISAIPAGDHLMTTTFSDDSTTTEEEDTARCLILLAQGRHFSTNNNNNNLFSSKRSSKIFRHDQETTTTSTCMYECKTCNRVFRSFQALGGHRASHRKKPAAVFSDEEDYPFKKLRLTTTTPPPSNNSLQLANNIMKPQQRPSPRIHECSYCGAEFTSGQALGGHMRRHRASGPVITSSNPVVTADPNEQTKHRNGLSLDLNLPAPDDHENQRFGFGARQQKGPVLSTSNALALVNCHY